MAVHWLVLLLPVLVVAAVTVGLVRRWRRTHKRRVAAADAANSEILEAGRENARELREIKKILEDRL